MAVTNAMKASGRKPEPILAEILQGATDVSVKAKLVDPKKITFTAEVDATVDIDGTPTPSTYAVATADGKVRAYGDVDSIASQIMNLAPQKFVGGLSIAIVGAAQLTRTVNPPTDIIAAATKQKTKYQEKSADMADGIAKANAELALIASWENGTLAEQARFQELTARKASQVEYKAWLDAEITRLTDAIALASGGG